MADNMSRDEIIARLSAYFGIDRQECAEVLAGAEWVVPRAVGWLLDDVSVTCAFCREDIGMGDVVGCCPTALGHWHHYFHHSGCLAQVEEPVAGVWQPAMPHRCPPPPGEGAL
eukprot:EG_transcript_26527